MSTEENGQEQHSTHSMAISHSTKKKDWTKIQIRDEWLPLMRVNTDAENVVSGLLQSRQAQ